MHKHSTLLIASDTDGCHGIKKACTSLPISLTTHLPNESMQKGIQRTDASIVLIEEAHIEPKGIAALREQFPKGELLILCWLKTKDKALVKSLYEEGADDVIFEIDDFFGLKLMKSIKDFEFMRENVRRSQTDYLTNLYNRRSFHELAEGICTISKYENTNMCCAMIDIDHFKKVNDTYGHLVGDDVIQKIASIIKTHFRKNDLVGRYGGEEFIVLLHDISSEKAYELMNALREKIDALVIQHQEISLHVSISIGLHIGFEYSLKTLQGLADAMLYKAKKNGRNRVEM